MWEQKKIGLVKEVNSTSVIVAIDAEITSFARKIGDKVYYIGQIGSYVLVPIGKIYVIGMVSEFQKIEAPGGESPHSIMKVILIGMLKNNKFEAGVSLLPGADSPVYLLEDKDMKVVFSTYRQFDFSPGKLSIFENEPAYLDPNRFFGKHLAVLGSSGAGKSCTVASILQKVVDFPETRILVLDLHNEYKQAFPKGAKYFETAALELPYWLMNFEEIVEMLVDPSDENASIQISLLQDLIYAAKKSANKGLSEVITVDAPVFFDLNEVRSRLQFLDTEKTTVGGAGKEGPYFGKLTRLLVRLTSRMNDPRYAFMFKLRVCLTTDSVKPLLMMIFGLDGKSKITVMDMSGVPFDIVNTVAALLARVTFDFNFWNPHHSDLPMLLVFEEAHNYLSMGEGGSKAARRIVERIAKEGRKYGVSCMIVSQRPSEISETILSQCSNFVILRLLNPTDQAFIRRLVPETFTGLDTAIPMLRQGEAILVGDSIPMPQRVQIDFPNPPPLSSDVQFFDKWKKSGVKTNVSDVMDRWWSQKRS